MSDPLLMRDLAPTDRPRERLAELGAAALNHAELLAILLRTGLRGSSAVDLGHRLLSQFGTIEGLARAPFAQLCSVPGIGRDKAATLKAAFELARRLTAEARREAPAMTSPEAIANALRDELSWLDTERFVVVSLNTHRHLIRLDEIARGILDSVVVHAREVFRPAILANAHAVVLAHNHPSGDPTPSEADLNITRDLIRAGQLLRIEVLDHVILGRRTESRVRDYCSLKELGYFYS